MRRAGFDKDFWSDLRVRGLVAGGLLCLAGQPAQAGVFDLSHFVEPGNFALGIEPELNLTPNAGAGFNAKFRQGVGDWMDAQGIIGTGGGPRHFRIGGNLSFDAIPDVDKQPGMGVALQALYVSLPVSGQLETTAIPYVHKAFPTGNGAEAIDPFVAFPIGFGFSSGNYQTLATLVMGTLIKKSESISFSGELGINIDHTSTYFSGGVIFFH